MANPTMTEDPTAPSDTTESHQNDNPGQGDGDQPRRKRRRRRGGRGRNRNEGGAPDGTATSEAQGDAPRTDGAPAGDRPRREGGDSREGRGDRRGGRRRGGRGRGDDRGDRPHDDSTENAEPAPRQRKPRPEKEISPEHWEEVFQSGTFAELGLRNSVLKGIEANGFKSPTKIQATLIPLVMSGKDVLGQSRTGTGKTAAFGLPLFHMAQRDLPFQSLILAPTRELAVQIADELSSLGQFTPIRVSAVYGGQNVGVQARNLTKGPEIIVATPGRLMDMIQRGHIHLNNVKFVVLDEVDRMLDIGFRDDIKKILSQIRTEHQTVFVSATISEEIERLGRTFMKKDAEKMVTTGGSLTVSLVEQHYISVEPWDKRRLLLHLLTHEEPDLTIVFCRMKRTVDEVAKYLREHQIDAHAIHGDMYQGKRNSVMNRLRSGQLGVLVASDLAARGLDVDDISHVINYDLPEDPEIYIHRIGRTARAGRGGVAWAFVTPDQGPLLTQIEHLANTHVPEKKYPDFKAGPLPSGIAAQRERDAKRTEQVRSVSRLAANKDVPAATSAAAPDPNRFPGGVVPTKLPPKMMQGRVRTARSMKQLVAEKLSKPEGDASSA